MNQLGDTFLGTAFNREHSCHNRQFVLIEFQEVGGLQGFLDQFPGEIILPEVYVIHLQAGGRGGSNHIHYALPRTRGSLGQSAPADDIGVTEQIQCSVIAGHRIPSNALNNLVLRNSGIIHGDQHPACGLVVSLNITEIQPGGFQCLQSLVTEGIVSYGCHGICLRAEFLGEEREIHWSPSEAFP